MAISDYVWEAIASSAGTFKYDPGNVSVQADGMHLLLDYDGTTWWSSAVRGSLLFGLGTFQWVVKGISHSLSALNENVMLNLYLSDVASAAVLSTGFSKWGIAGASDNGFFSSRNTVGRGLHFPVALTGDTATLRIIRTAAGVSFRAYQGNVPIDQEGTLVNGWDITEAEGPGTIPLMDMIARMTLYNNADSVYKAPSDGLPVEVVILDFAYSGEGPLPTTFTINASAGANGSVSPSGAVSVNQGASQAFYITPASGYQISDVLVDGVSAGAISSYTFTNVQANHTISASFIPVATTTYTITASAGSGGTINPAGENEVTAGSNLTLAIIANAGYNIEGVSVDGVAQVVTNIDVMSYTFSNISTDHMIEAWFNVEPAQTATLVVNTSPVSAPIFVDGYLAGTGSVEFTLMAGPHDVSFGDAEGYVTPAPQTFDLAGGETRIITGIYVTAVGYLEIGTSPIAGTIFVDGALVGTGSAEVTVSAGVPHTVSYGAVEGYITPAPQSVTALDGETVVLAGVYTPGKEKSQTLPIVLGGVGFLGLLALLSKIKPGSQK